MQISSSNTIFVRKSFDLDHYIINHITIGFPYCVLRLVSILFLIIFIQIKIFCFTSDCSWFLGRHFGVIPFRKWSISTSLICIERDQKGPCMKIKQNKTVPITFKIEYIFKYYGPDG